uniref:Chemokine-like factor n=1 Tax=Macaca mulatta TaxID=9544 RepID=A0A5F7ZIF3_MACMU
MANVQPKIKHRPFCFSVKGHVKMLRLDIINSMVTTVFMLIVSVLALIPETTPLTVGGGVSGSLSAFFLQVLSECKFTWKTDVRIESYTVFILEILRPIYSA